MRQDVWARYAPSGSRIEQRRRSLRLVGYDYTQAGAYFVTLCTQDRMCFFGSIERDEMQPNEAGQMVCDWWEECARKFPLLILDEYVIMPNHFHGVVILDGQPLAMTRRGPEGQEHLKGQPYRSAPTLGDVMEWFKTMTTNAYIRGVKQQGWKPFPGRLWQRNYYEHILRSERGLNAIRQYIVDNPRNWQKDMENPSHL